MYVEYCNYNKQIKDGKKEGAVITKALENGIRNFAMPVDFIKKLKNLLSSDCVLAAPIDFPLGQSGLKTKQASTIHSLKMGANAIDYTLNFSDSKQGIDRVLLELSPIVEICKDNGASLRVFINYPIWSSKEVFEMVYAFILAGVDYVFPSIGYHHDDFLDNLIVAKNVQDKAGVPSICNGYIWQEKQLNLTLDTEIFGIRLYGVDFWCNYYSRGGNRAVRTKKD